MDGFTDKGQMCVIVRAFLWNRSALRRSRLKMTWCCCVRTALHLNTGEGGREGRGSDVPGGAFTPYFSARSKPQSKKQPRLGMRSFPNENVLSDFPAQINVEQQLCDGRPASALKGSEQRQRCCAHAHF